MNRVVHFEIHADDPKRAAAFYSTVFGWKFNQWGDIEYWLITTGDDSQPGINGGLSKRKPGQHGDIIMAYVCTVEVKLLDDSVEAVKANGGQNVVPRMPVPGVGWLAYCKDTEGNVFGLMQNDTSAK